MTAGCDMTNTLKVVRTCITQTRLVIDYSAPQVATTIELKSNLSLNGIDLLPDLVTLADPTLSMLSGTAQITNANISTLTCDLTSNLTAGFGISITSVGGKPVIANTGGSVTDPLNLSKLNVSNISCDEGITTDTITCDLTPNLTAGAGVSITSVANKPVISAVNSVSANVPVSDFIETLTIIPSGTIPFVNQAAGQGSQLMSVYNYQGGTAYTAANMFTVYAGDKIHFTWKQSGWVQTTAQQSYVICYLVKGTNPVPQPGDRIEVGRIFEYIYFSSDHEEITGSFVYNVTSTFSFYRSQVEGAPNLVTQGQDYGAATAVVYRASVPNSIVVPNLIDATNISVVNLSVTGDITTPAATITDLTIGPGGIFNHDLTPNLVAGSNITITSVGGKAQISSDVPDPLNRLQINTSNLSVDVDLSVVNNATINNISVGNDVTITRDLQVQRFLDAGKPSFIMCTRTGSIALSGTSFLATYNSATTAQQNSQFTFSSGGSGIAVNTGGWYRVSWAFGFIRTSIVGGDRAQVRSYIQVRPAVGSYTFDASKHTISSHVI
jgi:hypothetical protein